MINWQLSAGIYHAAWPADGLGHGKAICLSVCHAHGLWQNEAKFCRYCYTTHVCNEPIVFSRNFLDPCMHFTAFVSHSCCICGL